MGRQVTSWVAVAMLGTSTHRAWLKSVATSAIRHHRSPIGGVAWSAWAEALNVNGHFSKVVKGDLMMEIPKTAEVWDALGLRFKFFHFQVIPISILSLEKKIWVFWVFVAYVACTKACLVWFWGLMQSGHLWWSRLLQQKMRMLIHGLEHILVVLGCFSFREFECWWCQKAVIWFYRTVFGFYMSPILT